MRIRLVPTGLLLLVGTGGPLVAADASVGSASTAIHVLRKLDYRYFLAGGTCAAISHGITTPIDVVCGSWSRIVCFPFEGCALAGVINALSPCLLPGVSPCSFCRYLAQVKTRIQADPKKYQGMTSTAVAIVKEDGPQALLGGLGPTVVGYGIEGAMKFGVYEVMKPIFASVFAGNKGIAFLLASIIAGAVAALLLCPMESTRIRIVTDPAYANKGLLTGFPKLVADEGLWSTFSGIWAMLAKQVPYTFGKQVSFDVFAGMLYAFFHSVQEKMALTDGAIKWAVSVSAAFLASIIACIFSQPGDMILTETYRPSKATSTARSPSKGNAKQSSSFADIIQRIYATGGLSNFFTGTQARIVHVGLIITSQLVIYDVVKQLLGLPATGSH